MISDGEKNKHMMCIGRMEMDLTCTVIANKYLHEALINAYGCGSGY